MAREAIGPKPARVAARSFRGEGERVLGGTFVFPFRRALMSISLEVPTPKGCYWIAVGVSPRTPVRCHHSTPKG